MSGIHSKTSLVRSKSQPPPVAGHSRDQHSKSPQRQPRRNPVWDDNVRDPEEYRATTEERAKKAAARVSKNIDAAREQLQEKRIRDELARKSRSRANARNRPVKREVIVSVREIEELLEESNHVLAESRKLLSLHQERFGR